jgi:hypothetical protein
MNQSRSTPSHLREHHLHRLSVPAARRNRLRHAEPAEELGRLQTAEATRGHLDEIKPGSLSAADLSHGAISVLRSTSSYSETESDARYLRGTITEVKSFKLGEGSAEATSAQVSCPKGYEAIGGGVDTSNYIYDKVSVSTPAFAGRRPEEFIGQGEHQEGPADGWFGAITVQGYRESSPFAFDEVVVICSAIG